MAVPTITALSPVAGHTGGRTLVEIEGTNFAIHPASSPVNGRVPEPPQGVSVVFGGKPAREVRVASPTLLYAITPIHSPGPNSAPIAVDVVVQNLDAAGAAIPGERATAVAAYTFLLPDLVDESDLARVCRVFLKELRRQVTPNSDWPVHTNFDDTTGDQLSFTKLPVLPGLVLSEVSIEDNDLYAKRDPVEVEMPDGSIITTAPPVTVDIVITIVGVSDSSPELINLYAALKRFFRKNTELEVLRDEANPSRGTVTYELEWTKFDKSKLGITSSESNLRTFAGSAIIRGFDIEALAGLPLGGPGAAATDSYEAVMDVGKSATDVVLVPSATMPIP